MAYQLDDVKPGDLIKASVWKEMYAAIIDMDTRLARLESIVPVGGGVIITQLVPAGPVRMGDTLHLIGRNFGLPSMNTISIDGNNVNVVFINPSNDNQLSFAIPAILGIPATGKLVTLNLSNPNGFASTTFFLLPSQPTIPTGTLFLAMSKPPALPIIAAGIVLPFEFTVTGVSSLDDDYTVTPVVDAGWAATLVNAAGVAIVPPQIHIPAASSPSSVNSKFTIAVTPPAGTAAGVVGNLTVSLKANHNPTGLNTATPAPLPLKVGSPPPGAQDNVIIIVSNVSPPATMTPPAAPVGGLISIPRGNSGRLDFLVALKTADLYDVAVNFDNSTGWTFSLLSGNQIPRGGLNASVTLILTAGQGAAATNMNIKITSNGNALVTGTLPQAITAV